MRTFAERDVAVQHHQVTRDDPGQLDRSSQDGHVALDGAALGDTRAAAEAERGGTVVELDQLVGHPPRQLLALGQRLAHPDGDGVLRG